MNGDFSNIDGGDLLMIFVKNPEPGKVKTRLAKDIGNDKALEVYKMLLEHTMQQALGVTCFRMVFYSDYIDFDDRFNHQYFLKDEQVQGDLGERLKIAFEENFKEGFDKIVCIGSDCFELSSSILRKAFKALDDHDTVIGPAHDGGYYLIGMKNHTPKLFENKEWSTPNVLLDTLLDLKNLNLSYNLLTTLSDIDEVDDLSPELKAKIL